MHVCPVNKVVCKGEAKGTLRDWIKTEVFSQGSRKLRYCKMQNQQCFPLASAINIH